MIYELNPPHLINVVTLPCGSQNVVKCSITPGHYRKQLHKMYHSFVKVDWGHPMPCIYLSRMLYSKACMKQRLMTSTTYKNAWRKLGLTVTRTLALRLTSGVTIYDHVCMLVVDTERKLWPKCLFIWFTRTFYETVNVIWRIYNGYFAVNVKNWSCVHMHFWYFEFHEVV